MGSQLCLPRPRLLSPEARERLHEAALRILEAVGLRVRAPEAMAAAERTGLPVREGRVLFPRPLVEAFVAETRAGAEGAAAEEAAAP